MFNDEFVTRGAGFDDLSLFLFAGKFASAKWAKRFRVADGYYGHFTPQARLSANNTETFATLAARSKAKQQ